MPCFRILVLFDTNRTDPDRQTILNNLNNALLERHSLERVKRKSTFEFVYADENTYDGVNPSLDKFNLVFLFHHWNDFTSKLPTATQTLLVNWVTTGGTFVGSSWLSYNSGASAGTYTNYATMNSLLLVNKFQDPTDGDSTNWPTTISTFAVTPVASNTVSAANANYISSTTSANLPSRYVNITGSNTVQNSPTTLVNVTNDNAETAPYLLVKSVGTGLVFSFNSALQVYGLNVVAGGNANLNNTLLNFNSARIYFENIIVHNNIDLKGHHCVISNYICFREGSIVETDQGEIEINKLVPGVNTINKEPILHITETITNDSYLVQIEKDALGKNVPSSTTVMTKNHLIKMDGVNLEAKNFLSYKGVSKIPNTNEVLYNVLMKKYNFIKVQNLCVETLHPENIIARLLNAKIDERIKDDLIVELSKASVNKDYNRLRKINKFQGKWAILDNKKKTISNNQVLSRLNRK